MAWINDLTRETSGGAVGQATQFVVGAADESDRQIYHRVDQMYTDWNLKVALQIRWSGCRGNPCGCPGS